MSQVYEASAGTGKTTELVKRIVDAIAEGADVGKIVAVTFTHAAAGNMKLRVRAGLEHRQARETDPACRDLLARAARSLDRAFIGTIHAFCAQLLRRRPVEAGVDPVFTELAQPDALRVFGGVFRRWIEQKLSTPSPALSRALARLAWRDDGAPLDGLRIAAWNLAEWRDFDEPWEHRAFDRDTRLAALLTKAEGTVELRNRLRPSDRLYRDLRPIAELVERAQKAKDAGHLDWDIVESETLRLPNQLRWVNGKGPAVASWEELKAAIADFGLDADADLAAQLRDELWAVVGLYQQEKQRAGQLDFMDLLLHARQLLRHDAARAQLQLLYDRIFVDEFQDTDPLQAEILLLLAAADPAERDWRNAAPGPGKLFVVGDPKQSIYRFRRADARLFRRVCADLIASGAERGELKRSTRSTEAIQSFVNAAFESKVPEYLALEGGVAGAPNQPGIVALPMPTPYGMRNISNKKIDECSPDAVAAFIDWLCRDSGWKVRDRSTGAWIAIQPEHICILFRRFTNFGTDLTQEYVRRLEARGIPHLLVGSKSFHRREEIGTLRAALRAIEWLDDELSVFAVLRGSLCAIPDDVLLRFKNQYTRFQPWKPLPEDLDSDFDPIRDAFAMLRELHRRRNHRPIADTIHELLETVRAHAGFAFRKGGERVLANVYRLIDLARSFEVGGAATSFRAFVEYLESESESGETGEAPVLEQEGGGVQLMTVHKAKGLEFPVVILADLTAKLTGREGGDRYSDPDRRLCAQRLLWCAPWELRDHADDETKADEEEALRVAYVAATRARDLLVIAAIGEEQREGGWLSPLHEALYPEKDLWRRAAPAPGCPKFGGRTVLNRPPDQPDEVSIQPGLHRPQAGSHHVVWFDPEILRLDASKNEGIEFEEVLRGTAQQAADGLARYREWSAGRAARIEAGGAPRYRVATAEGLGAVEEAQDIPVETVTIAAEFGRPTGRAFGRLVHDILQRAERVEEVEALARTWGRRHGASDTECEAASRTAAAALARVLAMAGSQELQREVPLVVRLEDGRLVDGRIDLMWRDANGWTIVDYKTDRRDARKIGQLQLYALGLGRATGERVRAVVLEV
jgi:ATP-dependent helicase/nuclease subunit A